MKNWSLTDVYPPGSTFKIITVATALDLNVLKENSRVLDTGKMKLSLSDEIKNNELDNTEKFLNQVSEYSYSLSRKNIYNESLTDEDLKNLKDLHN